MKNYLKRRSVTSKRSKRAARASCWSAPADALRIRQSVISGLILPQLNEVYAPFPAIAALQLLAYYTAVLRGCDVDRPRNLAKSVTVE